MVSEQSHVLNPSCLLFCFPLGQHQLTHQFHLVWFNKAVVYNIDETAFAWSCTPDESTMHDRISWTWLDDSYMVIINIISTSGWSWRCSHFYHIFDSNCDILIFKWFACLSLSQHKMGMWPKILVYSFVIWPLSIMYILARCGLNIII